MGFDYIDLILLHHPGDGDVDAYKAMEQAVAGGKIRSICCLGELCARRILISKLSIVPSHRLSHLCTVLRLIRYLRAVSATVCFCAYAMYS